MKPSMTIRAAAVVFAGACLSGCVAAPVPVGDGPAYRSPAHPTPAYLGPQALRIENIK